MEIIENDLQPLVAPFVGERYADTSALADLIAPPYDVISPDERDRLAARNRANVVSVTLPRGDDPYGNAAATLAEWRNSGILVLDAEPSVYVLRQTYSIRDRTFARTGVIAAVSVEPYETGRVKPHEKTHAHVKKDRLALLRSTRTICESLFFLAPDAAGDLRNRLAGVTALAADVKTELDGVEVELWRVGGKAGERMAASASASHIYIADGHHRYETGWAFRDEVAQATRTLALLVPVGDTGLIVLPTHRLISGTIKTAAELGGLLEGRFDIRRLTAGEDGVEVLNACKKTACIIWFREGGQFLCELKDKVELGPELANRGPAVAALDIARIDALVVEPLKGTSGQLSYSADVADVEAALANEASIAVLVNPTGVNRVVEVAEAGAVMPQKATYFVPKVPSGLVFLKLG